MAILTISREFGSGGRETGQAVARALSYEYINKEQLTAEIRAAGREWEEWGRTLDEHCPTVWEKYDWSFRGFTALVQSLVLNHALKDRVVIMGRGGNFLLKDIPHALRIRIIAPLDRRIDRIMAREAVDKKTAHRLSEKTDKDRSCLIRLLYGRNWDDPAEYDMVFDTGGRTPDEIAALVSDALAEKEKCRTEAAEKFLLQKAKAAQLKADILTDQGLFIPTLDVYPEGEFLIIRGVIHNPKEHRKIEDMARKIAGDMPVKCELQYRS